MKKTKLLFFLVLMLLFASIKCAAGISNEPVKEDEFKVIGYYSGDLFNEPLDKLQTDKLTMLCMLF